MTGQVAIDTIGYLLRIICSWKIDCDVLQGEQFQNKVQAKGLHMPLTKEENCQPTNIWRSALHYRESV